MSTPTCSIHGTPMRAGKGGGFFCPKKNADGQFCDQRAAAPKPAAASAPAAPATSAAPGVSPDTLLLIASLEFAGRVYQGTGDSASALECVSRAYSGAKAEREVL